MSIRTQSPAPAATPAARRLLLLAGEPGCYPSTPPSKPPTAARQDECPHPPPPDGGQRFRATTPHATFCGERAGVRFSAGVGFTDSPIAAADLRRMGYAVEDRRPPTPAPAAGRQKG